MVVISSSRSNSRHANCMITVPSTTIDTSIVRSKQMRSTTRLNTAISACVELMLGCNIDSTDIQVPSAPTLSRANAKLDVLLMKLRRLRWKRSEGNVFIQLGFLGSLGGGMAYVLLLVATQIQ